MELRQRRALVDPAMAQHVGADDRAERAVGEGQRVDRAGADRASALGAGALAGETVGVEPDRGAIRQRGGQAREQPAGAAAGIEQLPAARRRPPIRPHSSAKFACSAANHHIRSSIAVELVVFGAVQRISLRILARSEPDRRRQLRQHAGGAETVAGDLAGGAAVPAVIGGDRVDRGERLVMRRVIEHARRRPGNSS